MVTSPTGQPNHRAYDVTDDGMIDDGNDVPSNARAPITTDEDGDDDNE